MVQALRVCIGLALVVWLAVPLGVLWALAWTAPLDTWLFALPRSGAWHLGVGWTWGLLCAAWLGVASRPGLRRLFRTLLAGDTRRRGRPLLFFNVLGGPILGYLAITRPLLTLALSPLVAYAVGDLARRHALGQAPHRELPSASTMGWELTMRIVGMSAVLGGLGLFLVAGIGMVPALPALALAELTRDDPALAEALRSSPFVAPVFAALPTILRVLAPLAALTVGLGAMALHIAIFSGIPGHVLGQYLDRDP